MPSLYLVSTPIGNLGDLSTRAVEVLGAADVILAEDTRRTATLLRHYGISGRLVSAHEHNERSRAETVVEMLQEGKEVALVSDAGTPLISDPGARIVDRVVEAGYTVVPIPGASAVLAALVGSGLPADRFTFYAFLPRKGGDRSALLAEIAASRYTTVMYESPHRLGALLEDLAAVAGGERRAVVARELTKLHEEFVRGTLAELAARYAEEAPRGEVVVVVEPNPSPDEGESGALDARTLAEALLAQGLAPSAVAKELRQRLDVPRNDAYRLAQELTDGG